MGGLHIEQAALVCIGQLVTGTGLEDIKTYASLDTVGLKSAVCDVNNIKKAWYTIQVIAAVLSKQLKLAFNSRDNKDQVFSAWIKVQLGSPMFNYWYNVLQSIKNVLLLLRSFREANFDLFISALELIVPLFFSRDHIHGWISDFLEDFKLLHIKMPAL